MVANVESKGRWHANRWRVVAWGAAGFILLVPLIAMAFTDEVNWDLTDFMVFGAMLLGVGVTFEFAARKAGTAAFTKTYKTGMALGLLAAFLLFWVNGAVGIIGSEDNDANLMYFGVLLIALLGALIARFEPRGMARAMMVTAIAQILTFVIALVAGWGFTGPITVFFASLWLGSAALFNQAATDTATAAVAVEE